MNKKVYDYFLDLESKSLPQQNGSLIGDNADIKRIGIVGKASSSRSVLKYRIADKEFFCKTEDTTRARFATHEIASSKMYGDLGLVTPPVYHMKRNGLITRYPTRISQDVYDIDSIICDPASKITLLSQLPIPKGNLTPYEILYNKSIRESLLSIMTEECFEELVNIFMLGDLRTDCDIHPDNYFLYKLDNSSKYCGVIPIDLEHSQTILSRLDTISKFSNYASKKKYESTIPFRYTFYSLLEGGYSYKATHNERLDNIKNLIQSGRLSSRQIDLLRKTIDYDFGKIMVDTCDRHHFPTSQRRTCDMVASLWEYNKKALEKEL